jgi:hypothetical protein
VERQFFDNEREVSPRVAQLTQAGPHSVLFTVRFVEPANPGPCERCGKPDPCVAYVTAFLVEPLILHVCRGCVGILFEFPGVNVWTAPEWEHGERYL